ncbi:MAG: hypothetical protein KGJ93_02500 [Patescibacteria group bacterium]|nr:hypothetical protein [Patescibacteria group bacterium]
MAQNQKIIWQAPEFRHYPKGYGWYFALGAISVMIVGYFAIERDIFAAISLGIMALLLFYFAKQQPQVVEIEITNKGIRYGAIIFPYKQIKHFWIVSNERHRTLNIHTTAWLNNMIILQLEDQNPEIVREYLINYLPEHTETEETTAQRLMHRLKF